MNPTDPKMVATTDDKPTYVVGTDDLIDGISDAVTGKLTDQFKDLLTPKTLSPLWERIIGLALAVVLSFLAAKYGINPPQVVVVGTSIATASP